MRFRFCATPVEIKTSLASIMALALVGLLAGCNFDRAEASQKLKQGLQEYESGGKAAAIEELKEAHQMDPTWAKPALNLAQIYQQLGEHDNAERYFREAMSRDPENPKIPYKLGTVLQEQNRHEDAITALEKAVQDNPKHAKALYRIGKSRLALGEYYDAIEDFTKSIEADPRMKIGEDDPGGANYYALGDLYLRFDFFDRALKVFDNGITNNPKTPRLYHGKGLAQLELERYRDAAESFEKALEINPDYHPATLSLAIAQNAMGQHDAAIEGIENYLSKAEDQARRIAAQGLLQKLKNQKKEQAKKAEESGQ